MRIGDAVYIIVPQITLEGKLCFYSTEEAKVISFDDYKMCLLVNYGTRVVIYTREAVYLTYELARVAKDRMNEGLSRTKAEQTKEEPNK